jgi:MOSC domain-containing protein YiiM
MTSPSGVVTHLHRSPAHTFSKRSEPVIKLVAGMGVEGDSHFGATVQHRSRVQADPSQPNLRQVHLISGELLDEVNQAGLEVGPGDLGENMTTRGIALTALPVGTVLQIGEALLGLTGLRNPCRQIDRFRPGLLGQLTDTTGAGHHRAGVMAVVLLGGEVGIGDRITASLPSGRSRALQRV